MQPTWSTWRDCTPVIWSVIWVCVNSGYTLHQARLLICMQQKTVTLNMKGKQLYSAAVCRRNGQ